MKKNKNKKRRPASLQMPSSIELMSTLVFPLSRICHSLDVVERAHDELSNALEDPDCGSDEVRDAAIIMCDTLNAFYSTLKGLNRS